MRIDMSTAIGISNQMIKTQAAISKSLERLSSGSRVNQYAPGNGQEADLAKITNLDSKIRGTNQAILNLNDSQGILQTAGAAISSQMEILQQMRELSVQASNGTLTSTDRAGINAQVQQLFAEFSSITSGTQFNGQKLLDGSFSTKTLQVGASSSNKYDISVGNLSASQVFQEAAGSGTFATATTNAASNNVILSNDFNNDGVLDYVSVSSVAVTFAKGNGDGTFTTHTQAEAQGGVFVSKDMNGDGNADLVSLSAGVIYLALGNGDGTFKAASTMTIGSSFDNTVDVGDVNGDGFVDIVASGSGSSVTDVLLGNGDGTFKAGTQSGYASVNQIKLADVNKDGILDAIGAGGGGLAYVSLGNGDGTFGAYTVFGNTGGVNSNQLSLADLNGDGNLDIVSGNTAGGYVGILLGNGDGTFSINATYSGKSTNLRIGDVNNDGKLDVLATGLTGSNLYLGNGNGTFQTPSSLNAVTGSNVSPSNTILADFNGDGVLDVVSGASTSVTNYNQAIAFNKYAGSDISVGTQSKAQAFLKIVDTAINNLKNEQSNIAKFSDRITETTNLNGSLEEDYQSAKSLIGDVDVATETAELTKNQILQQAQTAVLGQANLNMQVVLNLYKNF